MRTGLGGQTERPKEKTEGPWSDNGGLAKGQAVVKGKWDMRGNGWDMKGTNWGQMEAGWGHEGTDWGQRKMGHNAQNLSTFV